MKYMLILLAFLAIPATAAPIISEINLDIGTPPVIIVKKDNLGKFNQQSTAIGTSLARHCCDKAVKTLH